MQVGSRPDRGDKSNIAAEEIEEATMDSPGEICSRCVGSFNRKDHAVVYTKPKKLIEALKMLYNVKPQLRASQFRDRLSKMRDPDDGGLLFCWAKRNTSGMLLTEDQIQGWINTETQKEKKASGPTETDLRQVQLISQIEAETEGASSP